MKKQPTPDRIAQLAAITRMERGHLSVIRTSPDGTKYYNLQRREDGRNITEYIPLSELSTVEENIKAHENFQKIVEEHAAELSQQSRQQRKEEVKKKPVKPATTNLPNKKKSKKS
jgi:hypothetical protein